MRNLSFCLLLLASCAPAPDTTGEPDSCTWASAAWAGPVDADLASVFTGPDALAAPGDLMLANKHAAFVIQAVENPRTYYYFGGTPIDAVAMSGCTAAGPEQFGEIGFLPGRLNLTDFTSSSLRMFRGDTMEVLADGSDGGDAIVRVHGVDDTFWLVDFELSRQSWAGGKPRPLSPPLGIALTIDYVLHPDSPVLEIRITAENQISTANQIMVGAAAFPSDLTPALVHNDDDLAVGGFGLQTGVPWFAAASGQGAWAFAFETANMARTNVSGVEAMLDMRQFIGDPLVLGPSGTAGAASTFRAFLAVGATDESSAIGPLLEAFPVFAGREATSRQVRGTVHAEKDDAAIAGATVEVQLDKGDGDWSTFDRMRTDARGEFSGEIPVVPSDARPRRLLVHAEGRVDPAPVALDDAPTEDLRVRVGEPGAIDVQIADDHGAGLPVNVSLFDDRGTRRALFFVPPAGATLPVVPGRYTVAVTRGYEYTTYEAPLEVSAGSTTSVVAVLDHVVDTTGWVSFDGHVHAGPSPDSTVLLTTRFASVVTAGLDVAVHTEHEIIIDDKAALAASPWNGLMVSVIGEEVTATTPEHLSLYGTSPAPEFSVRGAPVRWYGLGLGQIYSNMRDRGAQAVVLNHPKSGCGWLCLIGWDTLLGEPTLDDPTVLGLAANTELWSWDLDGVELLNGEKYIFHVEGDRSSGLFDDWANWFSLGHAVTGVGASDVHGLDTPGSPRTYIPVPTEDPLLWDDSFLGDAMAQGRAQISTGAFADVAVGTKGIGDTATATDHRVALALRVQAMPAIDVDHVVVFYNCDGVLDLAADDPDAVVKLDALVDVETPEDGTLVVMAFGDGPAPLGLERLWSDVPRVITNPIFVDADGDGMWTPPGTRRCDYDGAVPRPAPGR